MSYFDNYLFKGYSDGDYSDIISLSNNTSVVFVSAAFSEVTTLNNILSNEAVLIQPSFNSVISLNTQLNKLCFVSPQFQSTTNLNLNLVNTNIILIQPTFEAVVNFNSQVNNFYFISPKIESITRLNDNLNLVYFLQVGLQEQTILNYNSASNRSIPIMVVEFTLYTANQINISLSS